VAWTDNSIMFWWEDGRTTYPDGTARAAKTAGWKKITDHGRSPLNIDIERIENKQRMVDGTMRRYTVTKKRTWTTSWANLPSTNSKANGFTTADGGYAGEDIEEFHNAHNNEFPMQLRRGDGTIETVTVMISDFSKEVPKRGIVDLWNLDVTLEEI
jgi:hypothetical protein